MAFDRLTTLSGNILSRAGRTNLGKIYNVVLYVVGGTGFESVTSCVIGHRFSIIASLLFYVPNPWLPYII